MMISLDVAHAIHPNHPEKNDPTSPIAVSYTHLDVYKRQLQEKNIADIAEDIASRPELKFVMIAGPSSSGKTTFSHRLSIQLRTQGLKPHPIGCLLYTSRCV